MNSLISFTSRNGKRKVYNEHHRLNNLNTGDNNDDANCNTCSRLGRICKQTAHFVEQSTIIIQYD